MPAMTETAQVGKRQELLDSIFNIEADATPLLSRLSVGKQPNQMLCEWICEKYPDVASTSVVDGTPATAPARVDRKTLSGYAHYFRREWGVTPLAQLTNAAGVARDEAGHQAMLAMLLLKRMIEQQFCSADDTAVQGAAGYTARGILSWLSTSPQATLAVPADFRPASGTQYTGAIASIAEANFITMFQNAFTVKRGLLDLDGFVGSTLRTYIDDLTNVYAVASTTSQPRAFYSAGKANVFNKSVDVIRSSFGEARITTSTFIGVTTSTGAASAYTANSGAFLDLSMWDVAYLQKPANTVLAPDGSGKKGFIDAVAILRCKNPLAQPMVLTNT